MRGDKGTQQNDEARREGLQRLGRLHHHTHGGHNVVHGRLADGGVVAKDLDQKVCGRNLILLGVYQPLVPYVREEDLDGGKQCQLGWLKVASAQCQYAIRLPHQRWDVLLSGAVERP